MNQAFDPLNLLLLAVAVVIFLRLRSVLGSRTGNERRYDPVPPSKTSGETVAGGKDDNVISLPGRGKIEDSGEDIEQTDPVWRDFAPEGSELAKGLESIGAVEPDFSPQHFLDGAEVAYEMIVCAFAEGDRKALKSLLSDDVFNGFNGAIEDREKVGETVNMQFVGINKAELVSAAAIDKQASLTVRFVSEMITSTVDSDGQLIDGNPDEVRKVNDVWTFERPLAAHDPNWKLAATEQVH